MCLDLGEDYKCVVWTRAGSRRRFVRVRVCLDLGSSYEYDRDSGYGYGYGLDLRSRYECDRVFCSLTEA